MRRASQDLGRQKERDQALEQAFRRIRERLPPDLTGSISLHFHQGLVRKLDWRDVELIDDLEAD